MSSVVSPRKREKTLQINIKKINNLLRAFFRAIESVRRGDDPNGTFVREGQFALMQPMLTFFLHLIS